MKNIFYYYSDSGVLNLIYDDDNTRISKRYYLYTLKNALQQFRKENGLQNKHIKIIKLI